MPLTKTPVPINFAKGLNQKIDPLQLPVDQFQNLKNSIFDKAGRLTKRNGYKNITNLPNTDQTTLTTLNDNLVATGSLLYSYSKDTNQWIEKGKVQPIQLSVQSNVRTSTGQSAPDVAVAANGLVCTVFADTDTHCYYQISDSSTGVQVTNRVALDNTAQDVRVVILGSYFLITFIITVSGAKHLVYKAIPTASPFTPGTTANFAPIIHLDSTNFGYDTVVANSNMYIGWGASDGTVKLMYLTSALASSAVSSVSTSSATLLSLVVDAPNNYIYITFWEFVQKGLIVAFDLTLSPIMSPTPFDTGDGGHVRTLSTVSVVPRVLTVLQEFIEPGVYSPFDSSIVTDSIFKFTLTLPVTGTGVGTLGTETVLMAAMGLASKLFLDNDKLYFFATYGNTQQSDPTTNSNQPSYFLLDIDGNVYMRLAYSNGGGYATNQILANVPFVNGEHFFPYRITDFITTVNKGTALPTGTPVSAIFTQTGINLAVFTLNVSGQTSSEIANALHLTGGIMWDYDATSTVENNFNWYPENISAQTSSGTLPAGTYYYVFTYEWTDNQGNIQRSAPSIPFKYVAAGSTLIELAIPTLFATYKTDPTNLIRIVGYRWSVAQPVYYQFTSVTTPLLNRLNVAFESITDELPDSAILGNAILYTTGGVVENIAAPPSLASALFNNRVFLIDSENKNLLWFSKQVIQNVPVEFSDLLTLYIAPTTGAQGSTGDMSAISAMDDKLIIFKKDAIYYINGTGPDNTGSNSQYSDPVFITSTVGCANPMSIVLTPNGLMFQSDKGIWLLGRDMSTSYIGAPVEDYNVNTVVSAQAIPATNQVRFVLDNNITLMYDYFYNQWAIHSNIKAISSTLYQGAHTYLNSLGGVYQETPNYYKDGSSPVLMSLTTSWINVAGLQGYERFYFMHLLGTYFTPFKLNVQLAYDYNMGAKQSIIVAPDNYTAPWGAEALWGSGGPWGGIGNVFEARVFPQKQKCESFQVTIDEVFDPNFGTDAGQGLTLSGLLLTVGLKKGYRTQSAKRSFG